MTLQQAFDKACRAWSISPDHPQRNSLEVFFILGAAAQQRLDAQHLRGAQYSQGYRPNPPPTVTAPSNLPPHITIEVFDPNT